MQRSRRVRTSDGMFLAVHERGTPGAPTVVCIHGYPDDSSVWDGVAAELAYSYHVVTYDVRGAGASDKPRRQDAYRLDQLVDDLAAVVDAVSPDRPVHLVAHDWGSVQAWHAVTGDRLTGRIASYTSISGPCLDHSAMWMRAALRGEAGVGDVVRQLVNSSYVLLFNLPYLPEWLWRKGILDRALAAKSAADRTPAPPARPAQTAQTAQTARPLPDKINGLELYRANLLRHVARPQPRRTDIPVQVLAPSRDPFVSPAFQVGAPAPWTSDLRVVNIEGGHWIITVRPDVVARHASELIQCAESGARAGDIGTT